MRDRRRALALTQASVAKAAVISIPTLHNLEQGKGSIRSLSRDLIGRIETFLRVLFALGIGVVAKWQLEA
ncbi:helix-turn-helix domain-containing protein [Thioclava sp. 15-R06ZXC-3]|uniref:Helix-turn-helix domain-containing protein n=1 Tax=Thioclava arctica TaxID=3238301 RepID=A0ABV3TPN2_9RHOB